MGSKIVGAVVEDASNEGIIGYPNMANASVVIRIGMWRRAGSRERSFRDIRVFIYLERRDITQETNTNDNM